MSSQPPIGYTDPNFPDPNGPNDATIVIYGYTPSLAVCVLGVILFSFSTFWHTIQVARYRTWYFTPIIVGCAMEVVGYIFRILSSKVDPYNVIYFVIQYFFIVVAPVFFSAAIYVILTRLINVVGRKYSPIPPRALLIIFIISDVVSTIVQIAGAALIGSAESNRKSPTTPNNILLVGLAVQVVSFSIFLILLALFFLRAKMAMAGIRKFSIALVIGALAIYLRTCYRLAATAEGLRSNLDTHEVFFGCLEFAPVVLAVYIFNIWHPGKWVDGVALQSRA